MKDWKGSTYELMMRVIGVLRYVVSTVVMLGAAPELFFLWSIWKGVSLVLPPWAYQYGDDITYSIYQRLVLFFFHHCTGLQVYFYGDTEEVFKKKETVLYIANHQSTVDWILTNMVAVEQGSLGHLRFVMKHELQMLPLYGYYFYQHGCIYVKRSHFEANKMVKSIEYLKDTRIPTWVVIFPEGTRFDPGDKGRATKSREVAIKAGLTPLEHHLTPRAKGAWLVTRHLHQRLDAVYDVTVAYAGTCNSIGSRTRAPHLVDFLLGKCKAVHIHVRRIPMSSVPVEESHFQRWIHSLFVEKDRLLKSFYSSDSATNAKVGPSNALLWGCGENGNGPVFKQNLGLRSTLPSLLIFSLVSIPLFFTRFGRSVYFNTLVGGTLGGYAWLAIASVC
ncbi:1-acyl-sn-glycerol-3-phosphate acyltransferase epsilon-like isoform X1 [Hetaerina americana]|uniref:1-acyl-sn-glycerol-3-phosphate acyltransferase epsilon-like isoform X1 n=2 Tax=Hetaerina americana TaxID=62018 RepID=UPI003A7F2AAF